MCKLGNSVKLTTVLILGKLKIISVIQIFKSLSHSFLAIIVSIRKKSENRLGTIFYSANIYSKPTQRNELSKMVILRKRNYK